MEVVILLHLKLQFRVHFSWKIVLSIQKLISANNKLSTVQVVKETQVVMEDGLQMSITMLSAMGLPLKLIILTLKLFLLVNQMEVLTKFLIIKEVLCLIALLLPPWFQEGLFRSLSQLEMPTGKIMQEES